MKKVTVALAALAAVGFAGAAMAETNPWHPGQTKVPVTIEVETIAEVMVDNAAGLVELTIQNGGTNHGYRNAVTRDVSYLSNTNIQVAASIGGGDIPKDSNFIILVDPGVRGWEVWTEARASKILRWTRGSTGYTAGALNTPQHAFNAPATPNMGTKSVQYFAYSDGPLSQDVGQHNFDVIWTVATGNF